MNSLKKEIKKIRLIIEKISKKYQIYLKKVN